MNGVMKLVDDDSPGYPIEETIVLVRKQITTSEGDSPFRPTSALTAPFQLIAP
jgi:hypothetical protein